MRMPAADLLPGDRINWPDDTGAERIVTIRKRLLPGERHGKRVLRFEAVFQGREGLLQVSDLGTVDARYE